MDTNDIVKTPSHYTDNSSGYECIDFTSKMGFLAGNALKYVWRAGKKGPAETCLRKAEEYIRRYNENDDLMPSGFGEDHPIASFEWCAEHFGLMRGAAIFHIIRADLNGTRCEVDHILKELIDEAEITNICKQVIERGDVFLNFLRDMQKSPAEHEMDRIRKTAEVLGFDVTLLEECYAKFASAATEATSDVKIVIHPPTRKIDDIAGIIRYLHQQAQGYLFNSRPASILYDAITALESIDETPDKNIEGLLMPPLRGI